MASRKDAPDICAAGAVVWRRRGRQVEVAVVHRPRYDDWSLPKGKLHHGESELAAAVREVGEETGSVVAVSRRLDRLGYRVGHERKEVAYWLARHVSGTFEVNEEVDELCWLSPRAARGRLSYPAEVTMLRDCGRLPLPDSTVVLVRHAKAGKRGDWDGPDRERPLDATGQRQAGRLTRFLGVFGVDRLVSADPERCRQTIAPFARRAGLQVEIEPLLGDHGWERSPRAAERALLALARPDHVTVVASQGDAIPGLLSRLQPGRSLPDTRKGAAWVLSWVDGTLLAADHYPDAAR